MESLMPKNLFERVNEKEHIVSIGKRCNKTNYLNVVDISQNSNLILFKS